MSQNRNQNLIAYFNSLTDEELSEQIEKTKNDRQSLTRIKWLLSALQFASVIVPAYFVVDALRNNKSTVSKSTQSGVSLLAGGASFFMLRFAQAAEKLASDRLEEGAAERSGILNQRNSRST